MKKMKKMSASIRLCLSGSEDFSTAFGPGTAQLLQGIEKYHSLNKACKDMGMAYSKAWKAIKKTEEQLGFELIERHGPKGSSLTTKGEKILRIYEKMQEALQRTVQEIFEKEDFFENN
ncbi:MAG: LysR family transcriptional regulator [Eubacteriaceae bacterium]|nr:LysR family transcriptional regulator [Eubacteriaceae bacterium]